ncbi:MAG: sugar ABC transporter substrate-binding protein [Lachnospiraceae bacterium]|nr:sugar ABC transporter substrate-binding protein [Lachnospiraceae bacterium]
MKKKRLVAMSMASLMAVTSMGFGITAKADDVVELTFMGWEASPLETQAVEDGIKAFEEQYPNIKVTYTPGLAGSEYNAKLLSSAAAKALPDVMFVAAESYRQIASKNALMELTDKFDENYPLDDFIASSRQIMEIDGHIYGISSCTVSPIVYYNKDVFDAAGIAYPSSDPAECWTMEEFREIAKQLTTEDIYGVYGLETVADTLNAQILSNGGTRYNEDYTQSTMNTPEVKEVLETIKAVRVEDGSAPDASTLDAVGMSAKQMLQTGKVAMLVDGSWSLQELAASGMNIGMAPMPSYGEVLTTGQAHLHAISATTEHPDEAWEFLKFLSGMDYQGALVKSGLWMPNRYSMYEEDAVNEWYDENVHGDSYRSMLDYFRDAAVDPTALQPSAQARDIIAEETDMYFKMDQDIDVTLQNLDSRIDAAIADALQQ